MPLFEGVDRIAVILYLLLVAAGMVCITSASYNDSIEEVFSFKHFYMKQVIWIGAAFGTALFILLLDSRYYHMYAYYAYAAGILLIAGTLVLPEKIAPVVNGAKAWYKFSESVRIQPVEFAKIATALAVARIMSNYSFSIKRIGDLFRVGLIIMLPMAIIVLQNDTGSGVVLCSFLFVLYREGLNKWICIPILMVAALFISSFLFTPLFLLSLLVLIFTISDAMMIGAWREHIVFLASVGVATLALYTLSLLLWDRALSAYVCMLIVMIAAVVVVALLAVKKNIASIFLTLALFVGSMIFVPTTDIIFESILKPHQRERILSFLGIVSDPSGADYNVNQSKIAIGSGGFYGKGFLNGTQTKLKYVPEQHTDFIFCTIGEEEGFIGAVLVTLLFIGLILRVIVIGERQPTIFGRVYAYCVASYFTFHFCINIGMVIGLTPVIGIPLPFFSYGGSSLWGFTTLLFILLKIDASRKNVLSY